MDAHLAGDHAGDQGEVKSVEAASQVNVIFDTPR